MTGMNSDDYGDWDSEAEDEDDTAEPGEDDLLEDQHNRNLVATRGVDEEALAEQTAHFQGTPFLELIKDVHTMRTLYGPHDPTINDLAEEIESGLRDILEQLRKNPMGLALEVFPVDPEQIRRAHKILGDLLEHYPEEGGV